MLNKDNAHLKAVLQALFVTFLWSTSWVLIKIGLQDIPALTFAGLRYFIAFLAVLVFYLFTDRPSQLNQLTKRDWVYLSILGILFYTITQGSQYLGLLYLPAINFSLLLNGTAVVVAVAGIFLLREIPTRFQWVGIAVFVLGVFIYFYPFAFAEGQALGYWIAFVHIMATSFSSIIGRGINRQKRLDPLTITLVSMGVGSIILLGMGWLLEPWPQLGMQGWLIIGWLAIVNTAFTFTLWNKTLRTLTATESSVINNTMLIQITILAWLFLGETLDWLQIIGLTVAGTGAIMVQIRRQSSQA